MIKTYMRKRIEEERAEKLNRDLKVTEFMIYKNLLNAIPPPVLESKYKDMVKAIIKPVASSIFDICKELRHETK